MENHGQHTTDLPGKAHSFAFVALRPEEVEEECGAEDGSHPHAGENVVRGCADIVVVVYVNRVVCDISDLVLFVGVI